IGVITQHPVNPDLAESITNAAKIAYAKREDEASLHKARNLFANKDEFLEFLEDHGFENQTVIFLASVEEYERAGDIRMEAEDYVSAIRLFRRARTVSSHHKASACLWAGLRANISFAIGYGKKPKQLSQLFRLSRDAGLSESEEEEVYLLEAVSSNDSARLKEYGIRYLSSGNNFRALLALDAWASADTIQGLPSASGVEAAEMLNMCLKLCAVTNNTTRMPNILDSQDARNLFCISSAGTAGRWRSESVAVKRHSFVHRSRTQTAGGRKRVSKAAAEIYSKDAVKSEIHKGLWTRLNKFINHVESLAQNSRAYELCIPFVTSGRCGDEAPDLCWREHAADTELTVPQFNSRFRLHILTIALLNQPRHQQSDGERADQAEKQRAWLDRLFKLCYPSTNTSGNLSDVVPSLIPEYKQAMQVVNSCLSRVFRGLHPATRPEDFISATLRTLLLRMTFDYASIISDLGRGQWLPSTGTAAERRRSSNPTEHRNLVSAALAWFAKDNSFRTKLGVYFLE
ncbi:hypothetical protein M407DRAFT_20454, partial [Tulasnella calospora MUT 4182]